MKLKCVDHDRRVMVFDSGETIHRNDGSKCDSNDLTIGGTIMEKEDVRMTQQLKDLTRPLFADEQLLTDIFEGIDLTRNPGC